MVKPVDEIPQLQDKKLLPDVSIPRVVCVSLQEEREGLWRRRRRRRRRVGLEEGL